MTTLDIIIGLGLAGGLAMGFRSGLIKQVVGFAGLVLAFLLAYSLMRPVGNIAVDSLGISPDVSPLVGFGLVFLAVQVVVFAVVRLGESILGALKLSSVNRVLGGGVGLFKAALIISVFFVALDKLEVPSERTRQRSALYGPVVTVMPSAWGFATAALPQVESLSERFGSAIEGQLPGSDAGPPVEDPSAEEPAVEE